MPLDQGIQLIVRTMQPDGTSACRGYAGLPLANPVLVSFIHVGSPEAQGDMDRLVDRFLGELAATGGGREVPFGGSSPDVDHALGQGDCQKLLVIVGDDRTRLRRGTVALKPWLGGDETFAILPVLPYSARPKFSALMPKGVGKQNAFFWMKEVGEALPALLATATVTPEQPKIFISYRQVDCASLAIQLFDSLSHDGFDVFLDHFRIPPGVNFQSRLTQELGDKSMVLLLESKHLLESKWVLYEIATAKKCGLGLLALNIGGAPEAKGVDEGVRMPLRPSDFVGRRLGGRLTGTALDSVRAKVRAEHDKALIHRRIHLERSFDHAVREAGAPPPVREPNGAFRVCAPGKDYLTWLTVRPPDLPDFHYVHGAAAKPTAGVIIGLSRLMEPPRAMRTAWLAGLCQLQLIDEGRLVWAARRMARGRL